MASRILDSDATNYTTGTSWVGGVAPTAADDASSDGSTAATFTIDTGSVSRSLDLNGYTGTVTASAVLTLGDASAPASARALRLASGMTIGALAVAFVSTHATQQTINTAGKTLGAVTIGATGTPDFALAAAMTSAAVTWTAGNVHWDGAADNSGFANSIASLASTVSTPVRTLTLGTSTTTLTNTSGTVWNMSGSLNVTVSGAASTITATAGTAGTTITINLGRIGDTYGTINLPGPNEWSLGSGATVVNIYRTGTPDSAGGNHLSTGLPANGPLTVTGTYSVVVTGASAATPGMTWPGNNAVPPTVFTVTGATIVADYGYWQDMNFYNGGADLDLTAGGTQVAGNCGRNRMVDGKAITFTAAVATSWNSASGGNWSDNTKWTGGRTPLPQDPMSFPIATVGTVDLNGQWLGAGIDTSAGSGALTLRANSGTNANILSNPSTGLVFKGRAGVTVSNAASNSIYLNSCGPNDTFTFGGCTWSANTQLSAGNGGNLHVTDSGTMSGTFQHRSGPLTINAGAVLTMPAYVSSATNANAKSKLVGPGVLALSSTGTVFSMTGTAAVNEQDDSAVIRITNTSSSTKTIATQGLTMGAIEIAGSGTGAVIFTGAASLKGITMSSSGTKTITLPGSATTTFREWLVKANNTSMISLASSSGTATVALTNSAVSADYLTLTNIAVSGGTLYAGSHSVDGGGNSGNIVWGDSPVGAPITGAGSGRYSGRSFQDEWEVMQYMDGLASGFDTAKRKKREKEADDA